MKANVSVGLLAQDSFNSSSDSAIFKSLMALASASPAGGGVDE